MIRVESTEGNIESAALLEEIERELPEFNNHLQRLGQQVTGGRGAGGVEWTMIKTFLMWRLENPPQT